MNRIPGKSCKAVMAGIFIWSLGFSGTALADSFSFGPISDAGGTGTATMNFTVVDHVVTATVYNTSPILLDDLSGPNAPGITVFGFDLNPDSLTLASWQITGVNISTNIEEIIGQGSGTASDADFDWLLTFDGNVNGIKLEYTPNTTTGVNGALYNPLALTTAFGAMPYYSPGTLTLTFTQGQTPTINTTDPYSPIVRMQNVGLDGEGSLKLPGTPVPEPSTVFLFATGLAGLALWRYRKSVKP
jgi:hypothetical protein